MVYGASIVKSDNRIPLRTEVKAPGPPGTGLLRRCTVRGTHKFARKSSHFFFTVSVPPDILIVCCIDYADARRREECTNLVVCVLSFGYVDMSGGDKSFFLRLISCSLFLNNFIARNKLRERLQSRNLGMNSIEYGSARRRKCYKSKQA